MSLYDGHFWFTWLWHKRCRKLQNFKQICPRNKFPGLKPYVSSKFVPPKSQVICNWFDYDSPIIDIWLDKVLLKDNGVYWRTSFGSTTLSFQRMQGIVRQNAYCRNPGKNWRRVSFSLHKFAYLQIIVQRTRK